MWERAPNAAGPPPVLPPRPPRPPFIPSCPTRALQEVPARLHMRWHGTLQQPLCHSINSLKSSKLGHAVREAKAPLIWPACR